MSTRNKCSMSNLPTSSAFRSTSPPSLLLRRQSSLARPSASMPFGPTATLLRLPFLGSKGIGSNCRKNDSRQSSRPWRGTKGLPVRPTEADYPRVAGGRIPQVHRHQGGPGSLPADRRYGLQSHFGGDHSLDGRRTSGQSRPQPIQSDRLDPLRQLHYLETTALEDRSSPLPCKLGDLRQ